MGGRVDGARAITIIVPIACETTRSNDGIVLRVVPVVIVVQSVVHTSAQNVANVGKCHDECRKFTHELKYRCRNGLGREGHRSCTALRKSRPGHRHTIQTVLANRTT